MSRSHCDDPANVLLAWYLNGSLDGAEEASVRSHLESCDVCAKELAELAEFASAVDAAAPSADRASYRSRPSAARARWAYAVAAALLVPATLGVLWALLGFPTGRTRGSTGGGGAERLERLRPTVTLELGAGPERDAAAVPTLVAPHDAAWVSVTFFLPVVTEGPVEVTLRDEAGTPLASEPAATGCDRAPGCALSFPIGLVRHPGRFKVLVRPVGGHRTFEFPFDVASAADR